MIKEEKILIVDHRSEPNFKQRGTSDVTVLTQLWIFISAFNIIINNFQRKFISESLKGI